MPQDSQALQIDYHLRALRLPGILREWRKITDEARKESIPYTTYLLKEMDDQKQISRFEKQFLRYDLIICDELGYIPFSTTGSQLLFKFLSLRYERGSVIFTSNLDFARWDSLFHDKQMTLALLDRITHRAHIFSMEGESYRFKEAMRRENKHA